jgi:hypothetical protein
MARKTKQGGSSGSQQTGQSKRKNDSPAGGRGKGAKADAPGNRTGETSARGSSGARKSANRPGASGTGAKKGVKGSSGARRSGSRSGGSQGRTKDE